MSGSDEEKWSDLEFDTLTFTQGDLEGAGFVGWLDFSDIGSSKFPNTGGVYVVWYNGPAKFSAKSCGGWYKGRDPSVPRSVLIANWVDGAEVVYIGATGKLKRRLGEFASFGTGKIAPHWGGRLIWHLADVRALRVAWMETHDRDPDTVKDKLIDRFRQIYRKKPFANDPDELGSYPD